MRTSISSRIKSFANAAYAPTWCPECGSRYEETTIGFREAGSYYVCPNASCIMFGERLRLPLPHRARTGKLKKLRPVTDF